MIYYTTSIFGVLYYTDNFFINTNKVNLQFLFFFGVWLLDVCWLNQIHHLIITIMVVYFKHKRII